jgi:broad specificity phosphatase PhoE
MSGEVRSALPGRNPRQSAIAGMIRLVPTRIVFETHSFSDDNERGLATGWLPGRLSERGRAAARELGARRRDDELAAVFASDLQRAVETVAIAFDGVAVPILLDWRLRECDYGDLNGTDAAALHENKAAYLEVPYPNGESWSGAVARVGGFLHDVGRRWQGRRVLVVGHMATRYALEHFLSGVPLSKLLRERFVWREGWEYELANDGV